MSTYISRGGTTVTFPSGYPPKVVSRFLGNEAARQVVTSIGLEQVVNEVPKQGDGFKITLRVEAMDESSVDTLMELVNGTGTLRVKYDPDSSGTVYYGAFSGVPTLETYDGPYPENAPTYCRVFRVTIPLVLWT